MAKIRNFSVILTAILLVLGLVLTGTGLWLRSRLPPKDPHPTELPLIVRSTLWLKAAKSSKLTIYRDGSVMYVEDTRGPIKRYRLRMWKTGELQPEELDSLKRLFIDGSFEALDDKNQFPGSPLPALPGVGEGIATGDMVCTISFNSDSSGRIITKSADLYLTRDGGLTFPDMPYPMNEIYATLEDIAQNKTREVLREHIS